MKPEHTKDRRDFTLRPDEETWRRLTQYCRSREDATGYLPSKNAILLEALNGWLDAKEKKLAKKQAV